MFISHTKKSTSLIAMAAIGVLAMSGCSASSNNASESSASASNSASASSLNSSGLTISNAWVKSVKGGMTAVFGDLKNDTKDPIVITSVETSFSANTQLHTTVLDSSGTSTMKQVDSFTVEPGETFKLEPGGNHIMVMDMKCSLPAGVEGTVKLMTKDNKELSFNVEARDYTGAKETYAPADSSASADSSMPAMDMDHSEMPMESSSSQMPMDHSSMSGMDMGDSSASARALPECGK